MSYVYKKEITITFTITKRLDLKDLVVYVYYTIDLLYKILYAKILRMPDRAPRNTFTICGLMQYAPYR